MAENGREYREKADLLIKQIKRMKRKLIKKYGPGVAKHWRR